MNLKDDFWYAIGAALRNFTEQSASPTDVVKALTCVLSPFMKETHYPKYFRLFEAEGLHLTPVHFYAPVPDTRVISEDLFAVDSELPGIKMNIEKQLCLLQEYFPKFREEYDGIPSDPSDDPSQYYFNNNYFSGTDACVLYCMIRHFRPNLMVEVGSGFSSLLAAQAARQNGNTEIVCIEPYPSEILRKGVPGIKQLLDVRVQDLGWKFFERLNSGDILFIDSSHVVQIGSDVNFLFLEVLPRLKPGVIVHIHDIYLPLGGRRDWVMERARFWNEQYLLQAFMIMNREYEVLFANYYLARNNLEELKTTFSRCPYWEGSSFWIRRIS